MASLPLSHRQMMSDVLQKILTEIGKDELRDLALTCQQLTLDQTIATEMMSKHRLIDVYNLLLRHTNDLGQVVLILNDFVPKVVKDLHPDLLKDMHELTEAINKNNEDFNLPKGSKLYGRDVEMQQLIDYMRWKKGKCIQLVNICGMAGIGKTFLVRHFGRRLRNEGECVVIYVDASGLTKLQDLSAKIQEKCNVGAAVSGHDLMDCFGSRLDKTCEFVLILDDLSALMSDSDVNKQTNMTKDLLTVLDQLIKQTRKSKLKMLVTSQIRFTITSERTEKKELLHIKSKIADYTKDISLSILPDEEAVKFLGSSMQSLTRQDKDKLMKLCAGHPYSLHIMGALANFDIACVSEFTKISTEDLNALNTEVADRMFPKAYDRLTDREKLILLAVALFEGDVQLRALYYIINPPESSQRFIAEVKKGLGNGFWLTFRSSDLLDEEERQTVAKTHHPLILKFLRRKIDSYAEDEIIVKLKERYIMYHISELIKIGKRCVPQPSDRLDFKERSFVQKICARFVHQQANFRTALAFVVKAKNPCLLFAKEAGSSELRSDDDIVNLFICLHQYHDWFDGYLIYALTEIIHMKLDDPKHRVLLWTLHVMMLAVTRDWRTLDSFLKQRTEDTKPSLIGSTSLQLFSLCKALYEYANGCLCTYAPWLKDSTDSQLVEKRMKTLKAALANLQYKHLLFGARRYFSTFVLLAQAEGTWRLNIHSVANIKAAYECCKKAKGLVKDVPILEPVVYTELAAYRSNEGDQYDDVGKAVSLYAEGQYFHNKVAEQFETRHMGKTGLAARNLNSYSVLMRSWASLLADECGKPRGKEAIERLKEARKIGEKVVRILENLSIWSPSKRELFIAYEHQGSYCYYQREFNYRYERDVSVMTKHLADSLRYYNRAYNLIKNDYRSCHISANEPALDRLTERLPKLMRMYGLPQESVDKAKANLEEVKRAAGRENSEQLDLSGSELYSSTEPESSSDEASNGSRGSPVLDQSAVMDTSALGGQEMVLQQVTQTSNEVPQQVTQTSDEEGATSSKRMKS